jgi:hypothetical protein
MSQRYITGEIDKIFWSFANSFLIRNIKVPSRIALFSLILQKDHFYFRWPRIMMNQILNVKLWELLGHNRLLKGIDQAGSKNLKSSRQKLMKYA